MNLYAIISILSAFVCGLLANFIYYYNPKNRLNQLIAFLAGFLAFLNFAIGRPKQSTPLIYGLK